MVFAQGGPALTKWVGFTAIEVCAAVAILGRPPAWLPKLAYPGKLSYGIYLWHYPVTVALKTQTSVDPMTGLLITLALSVPLAALSYHTVEAWFRRTAPAASPSRIPATQGECGPQPSPQ